MPATGDRCDFCRGSDRKTFCQLAGLPVPDRPPEITVNRYEPKHVFMHEGDPSLAIYCVRSGLVKLYKIGRSGDPLIIRLLGPGRLIGFRAVLAGEPYAASAEAVDSVTLCVIPGSYVQLLLGTSVEFNRRLLVLMAGELRMSEEQMMSLAEDSVRQRTARLLRSFLEEASLGTARDIALPVPLMRKEMAQMLGTSPETLSKVLHSLAREGVLRLTRSEILVRDPEALRTIAPDFSR
jgi:CRP/FNR family transcriptional regulator, polysaccharide utilization system transcription regulator